MATKLYLHDLTYSLGGTLPAGDQSTATANESSPSASTLREMNTTIGSSQASLAITSTASTSAQKAFMGMWATRPLEAQSGIGAGTITLNIADSESNTSMNFVPFSMNYYLWRPSTGAVVATLLDQPGGNAASLATEASSASSEQVSTQTVTVGAPGLTAAAGDILLAEFWVLFTQGMATAYTGTIYYDGTTENATENAVVSNHAAYIQLTENLVFQAASAALTGNAATGAAGTATPSISVPITGNQATGAAGTLKAAISPALTGNAATGQVGTVTAVGGDKLVALTGNSAIGTVGTVKPSTSKAVTGNQATSNVGSVSPNNSPPLTGNQATGNTGTVKPNLNVGVTGNQATGQTGTVTVSISGNVTVALTGVSATSAVGNLGVSRNKALTGNAATAAVGTLRADRSIIISGNAAATALGALGVSRNKALTGVSAVGQLGTISAMITLPPRLQQAIKEAYASAPSGVVILHTLEFRHPNFIDDFNQPTAIRVVLDHQDLNAKLEADAPQNPGEYVTFIAFSFELSLPNIEAVSTPEVTISLDNVTRDIEDSLALAALSPYPVQVTYRPYLNTDLTTPQMIPPLTLTLTSAEADDFRVTARASYGNTANRAYPAQLYNTTRFPGLLRS